MLDGKYGTETYYKGSKVIIDLADIGGTYETIVMRPDGMDIDGGRFESLAEAIDHYHKLVKQYSDSAVKPLTGRYAKLRDDLKKALAIGVQAEKENPEDGGTCNFDAVAIHLPRWRAALVEQAAKEAGTRCFDWKLYGHKHIVFAPDTNAQANARSRNAEAMENALRDMGYTVTSYAMMD